MRGQYSALDAARLSAAMPDGVAPGADDASLATGTLVAIDSTRRLVQVTLAGSSPFWVPASEAVYAIPSRVRLLRNPIDGRVIYCLGPLDDAQEIVQGEVTSINTTAGTLTVATLGDAFVLPYVAGTYAVGSKVHVLRGQGIGRPLIVLGPQGSFAGSDPGGSGGGSSNPGTSVLKVKTITPQWSGSYRSAFNRWDSWNTDRYGGRSTLWQGDDYGSGVMVGLATYGNQIVNLQADSIVEIVATVTRADSSVTSAKTPVLRASTNGSKPGGAPNQSGTSAAGNAVAPGRTTKVTMHSSVLDGFRTGTYKGIVTVGTDYAGFAGTARGDGMALTIKYRVTQ